MLVARDQVLGGDKNGAIETTYHDSSSHWREYHSSRNGYHKHGTTKLGVATETTKSQAKMVAKQH